MSTLGSTWYRALMLRTVVCCLAIAGCSSKTTVSVDGVNALVVAKHKAKLHFVQRETESGLNWSVKYTIAAPKEWKQTSSGAFEAPDVALYGNSSIWVRSSCDQRSGCVEQDWNALIDADIKAAMLTVERDEKSARRRVVVGTPTVINTDRLSVSVYWWNENGAEYFACTASLDPQVKDSAAAFEKACDSVVVHRE